MFAQIFLGIAMLVKGVFHLVKSDIFVSSKVKRNISEQHIGNYQKVMALPHFLLGAIFISMGIVEKMDILQTPIFIGIYIVLSAITLGMVLIINKKYSGNCLLK